MSNNKELDEWVAPLEVSRQKLGSLTRSLAEAYSRLALESDDQFLATPVTKLPTGEELGEYLAIDLGGSNLRVAFVNLLGTKRDPKRRFSLSSYDERIQKYNQKSWPIADSLKDEKAEDLFAWIGDCLAEVIAERYKDVQKEDTPSEIPLGITFSFPMMQSTLSEATLLPMGKGFSITSNPDLGHLVQQGYARHVSTLPRIRLAAIANDSATTLISLSYTTRAKPHSKAMIGLILGTGCNAAVPMKPSSLKRSKVEYATRGAASASVDTVVVNTEWTIRGVRPALDRNHMITAWDEAQDAALPTPGFQPFEYLTAGSYLGEIVRLGAVDFFTRHLGHPSSDLPPALAARNGLSTTFLCWNVAPVPDGEGAAEAVARALNASPDFGRHPGWVWDADRANVVLRIERAVLRRSQALISAALTALLVASGELSLEEEKEKEEKEDEGPPAGAPAAKTNGAAAAAAAVATGRGENGVNGHASAAPSVSNELVVAYCGGLICQYAGYVESVQTCLEALREDLVQEKDTAVVLREASEGGVIGAGVLAATATVSGGY